MFLFKFYFYVYWIWTYYVSLRKKAHKEYGWNKEDFYRRLHDLLLTAASSIWTKESRRIFYFFGIFQKPYESYYERTRSKFLLLFDRCNNIEIICHSHQYTARMPPHLNWKLSTSDVLLSFETGNELLTWLIHLR